jgi:XRE family transcriptional regulator, regulator of sulfur utilization
MKADSPLASLRKSKGMSQEALAEVCGVSLRAIQRIEAGETSPRPHTIKVIAQALGVQVEALAGTFNTTTAFNDKDTTLPALRIVNFSALAGLIIPFANVFVPILLARRYGNLKETLLYKKIISFQLIWSLVTVLAVVFTPLLLKLFTQTVAFGKAPSPIVLTYGVMILLNVFFTISSTFQLRSGTSIYGWVPPVF